MQLQTLQYKIGIKVACIINKSLVVGEHAFPLTEIVSWMAHSTILFMNSSCVGYNPCDFHLTIYKCGAYPF